LAVGKRTEAVNRGLKAGPGGQAALIVCEREREKERKRKRDRERGLHSSSILTTETSIFLFLGLYFSL
jgi:hypothetical protein